MSSGSAIDLAGMLTAAGAAVPGPPEGPTPTSGPAADEATLLHLLRVLHRVEGSGARTSIDRALVEAARAAFTALARQSERLLAPGTGTAPTAPELEPARAPRQPAAKKRGGGRGPANPRSGPAL